MVMNSISPASLKQLDSLLIQMNQCAQHLEILSQSEFESIRQMDGERVLSLSNERLALYQQFGQLEQACRDLLAQEDISDDLTLEVVIDLYAGDKASGLQALRRTLYDRLLHVDQCNQENRLRMHAAYSVSSAILQHLGLGQQEQTYSPRTSG